MFLLLALLTSVAQADTTRDCVTRDGSWRLVTTSTVQPGPRTSTAHTRLIHDGAILSEEAVVWSDRGARPNKNRYGYTWSDEQTALVPVVPEPSSGTKTLGQRPPQVEAFSTSVTIDRLDGASVGPGLASSVTLVVVCQVTHVTMLRP